MRKIHVADEVKLLVIERRITKRDRVMDVYLKIPGRKVEYAFTRRFYISCFELCKEGISINRLITHKENNVAIMNLVDYTKRMLSYLVDEFEIPLVS